MEKDKMCVCGDPESQHVDGCEQCVVPECGCKEFESAEPACSNCGEESEELHAFKHEDGEDFYLCEECYQETNN